MTHKTYNRRHATQLLPLLGAIGREIRERSETLAALEERIERLEAQGTNPAVEDEIHRLVAEAAAHRRGIRQAKAELDRLGCSVVGTAPLTFRIPGRVGEAKQSFVWQTGDPVLK